MRDWQEYLTMLKNGGLNPDIEMTIEEAVGNAPVSFEDLQYACAIVSAYCLVKTLACVHGGSGITHDIHIASAVDLTVALHTRLLLKCSA